MLRLLAGWIWRLITGKKRVFKAMPPPIPGIVFQVLPERGADGSIRSRSRIAFDGADMLTPEEIADLRKSAKETSAYMQGRFAHLRPKPEEK